jgi:hypothetical protein
MSQERLAPQQPEDCLAQSRKSRCKGGTLIAADVWTVEEHRRRLSDPERPYRPAECPKVTAPPTAFFSGNEAMRRLGAWRGEPGSRLRTSPE